MQPAYDPEYLKKLQKAEGERAAREKEEQAAAARAAAEEERRLAKLAAKEEEERIKRERARYAELCRSQWEEFQKTKHCAPPTLLPLQALAEHTSFDAFLLESSARLRYTSARWDCDDPLFRQELATFKDRSTWDSRQALRSFEKHLRSAGPLLALTGRLRFGKHVETLRGSVVSNEVPDIGSPERERLIKQSDLLRRKWSEHLDGKDQAMFSVHRFGDKTLVHVGSSIYGSAFVTVPHSMDPETVAAALLSCIANSVGSLIPRGKIIGTLDGDHQAVNLQRVFPHNLVVRTSKADDTVFVAALELIGGRDAPNPTNTSVHLGVPANPVELESTQRGADWSLWDGVASLWKKRASRNGFESLRTASATDVLTSLETEKNVIIVIAHGDERTIYMPAPPPEGSRLSADQVLDRKNEISANKPVVYLFCCETAAISGLKNFSQVLLEAGAAAVVAPQSTIDARRSADYFDALVKRKATAGDTLSNLREATRRSKYREMEVWFA